jgi:hypothetical protein
LNIIFYQETKHFYIDDIRVHTEEICFWFHSSKTITIITFRYSNIFGVLNMFMNDHKNLQCKKSGIKFFCP